MALYAPAILLAGSAGWLSVFGDGRIFAITVLVLLAGTMIIQLREQARRHRRHRHDR